MTKFTRFQVNILIFFHLYSTLIARVSVEKESEFRRTPQIFVEEFFGILRNTLGTPIFVPWLQGLALKIGWFVG
jgi:hypothetical protein